MIYPDPSRGIPRDTRTVPLGYLLASVRWLNRGHKAFEKNLMAQFGPDGVKLFVRAIRARLFLDHATISPYYRSLLTRLDPPPCRCGKPGTRIIGTITFCDKCGPTMRATINKAHVLKQWTEATEQYRHDNRDYVIRERNRNHLHQCKRRRR